jgi:hypothetical protein
VLPHGLTVAEVARNAFTILGDNGLIRAAHGHSCSECSQPHKSRPDFLTEDDPAAMVGLDEGQRVPVLVPVPEGQNTEQTAQNIQLIQQMEPIMNDNSMDVDNPENVNMIVLDGIVMGPTVGL